MGLREENSRISWLARQVSSFVAAGYQIEKGKPNPALDAAQTLGYDDIEVAFLKAGPAEPAAPKENAVGSFERFMMGLGATGGAKRGQ